MDANNIYLICTYKDVHIYVKKQFSDHFLWQTLRYRSFLTFSSYKPTWEHWIEINFFLSHMNVNGLCFRILLQWDHAGLADTLLCVHLPGVHSQTPEPSGWWTAWNHWPMPGNHPRVHCLWSCKLPLTLRKIHWSNYRFPSIHVYKWLLKDQNKSVFHKNMSAILLEVSKEFMFDDNFPCTITVLHVQLLV